MPIGGGRLDRYTHHFVTRPNIYTYIQYTYI